MESLQGLGASVLSKAVASAIVAAHRRTQTQQQQEVIHSSGEVRHAVPTQVAEEIVREFSLASPLPVASPASPAPVSPPPSPTAVARAPSSPTTPACSVLGKSKEHEDIGESLKAIADTAEVSSPEHANSRTPMLPRQRMQLAVQLHVLRFILQGEFVPVLVRKAFKALMPSQLKEHRSHVDGLNAAASISKAIPNLTHYLMQVLSARFEPVRPSPPFFLEERDRYIEYCMRRRLQDLDGRIDSLSVSEALERRKLRVVALQRKVRQGVGSVLKLCDIESGNYRVEKQVEAEARTRERKRRRAQAESLKAVRKERKAFLASVVAHAAAFGKFHRENCRMQRRLAASAQKFLVEQDHMRKSRLKVAQRTRMKALREHDEVEYLRLVREAKNERLLLILRETSSYMKSLGAKIAKGRHQEEIENAGGSVALSNGEVDDLGGSVEYFRLTHAVQEKLCEQPSLLQFGKLRSYQMVGLNWLVSLHNNNLNGILADEMGLGKTIQTISLVAYLMETKRINGPFLIVAPMSTLWNNWVAEFDRWLPNVKKIVYDGHKDRRRAIRQGELFTGDFSVLITTFDFVMRDKRWLQKIHWELLVVDEAHRLKNSGCKLACVLCQNYRSRSRLALTGTPLQNQLPELWSLLNFLHPKVFNAATDFQRWFASPLSSLQAGGSAADTLTELTEEEHMLIIDRLHSVLRPFMLRRMKSEVEKDLPDKVDKVVRCELSPLQRFFYKSVVDKDVSVHNRVMQLRKICNHPLLFSPYFKHLSEYRDELDEETLVHSCGKMSILDRILPKLKAAGHRVLIFFQMTRMMDVFQIYLQRRGYRFLRLDGATSAESRSCRLQQFNADGSEEFIFMLSTKAGGVGINLQSADTVIIYDSDWNPQNDMQAQARSHRIGQKNQVLVIRFLTSGTIEETVFARASDKLDAEAMVIQAGMFHQQYRKETSQKMVADLLRENDDEAADDDIPDDDEVSASIARSVAELEMFRLMDRSQSPRVESSSFVVPEWAIEWWESAAHRAFDRSSLLGASGISSAAASATPSEAAVEYSEPDLDELPQTVAPLRLSILPTPKADAKCKTVRIKINGVVIHQGLMASFKKRKKRQTRTEKKEMGALSPLRLVLK